MATKNRLKLESIEESLLPTSLPPLKPGAKPRKQQTVSSFHETMTRNAAYLMLSSISQKAVAEWTQEPWEYNNVRKAAKWVRDYLQPKIDKLSFHIGRMSAEQWTILKLTNGSHSDLRQLYALQTEVKNEWFKRPRFPNDKGRLKKEGI